MKYAWLIGLFVVVRFSIAQNLDNAWQLTLPLSVAVPLGQFNQTTQGSDAYFGLGGEINAPLFKETPLRAGLSFRYFWLGSKSRDVNINDSLQNIDVNTKVFGGMMPLHAFVRFDPMNIYDYPVLPYAGGFIGPRIFNVTTRTELDFNDGLEPENEYDRQVNVAVSYGFQVGINIRIKEFLLLDLRWERAYGGLAKYLDISTISIDDEGYASYELHTTRTDVDIFTVGLVLILTPE